MAYKKCPRCELNYIKDTEQYCKVCLVDMGKLAGDHILDDDILDEDLRLCPECGENYLEEGEETVLRLPHRADEAAFGKGCYEQSGGRHGI